MTTYSDDITVEARDGQSFELVDEGPYQMEITGIERFEGRNFNTGEPQDAIKATFTIIGGDWQDSTVDRVITVPKSLTDDRAWLHKLIKAATGIAPEAGQSYPLRATLLGKRVNGMVEHHTTKQGGVFSRVASVSVIPPKRQRPAAARTVIDDDSDDLADA